MNRYTVSRDLIRSAQITASAWESPVFIGCTRERENQCAGELMVSRNRPQVVAVIVGPEAVEVMPGWEVEVNR